MTPTQLREMKVTIAVLKKHKGNRTRASKDKQLNIDLRTLFRRISKYKELGIKVPEAK